MDLSQFIAETPATRHDGWSPELKVRFLDHLSVKGNVRSACAAVGMSHEAAYRLRRREPLFARGWNAALGLAREHATEVLASRAIDGIVEDVWYRGDFVGTRVRHDSRLLLAHLGRLDRLAGRGEAQQDMGRFDELLALVLEEEVPEEVGDDRELPPDRTSFIASAEHQAKNRCRWEMPEPEAEDDAEPLSEEEQWERDEDRRIEVEEACDEAAHAASLEAAALWDEWFRQVCGRVDEVLDRTVSMASTSAGEPGQNRHPELVSGPIVPEAQGPGFESGGAVNSTHDSSTWADRKMGPETSSG